jgi:hypothetical protein
MFLKHKFKGNKNMKKIAIATLVLAAFGAMAADSFTVESQHINNNQAAAQQQYVLGVKKEFTGFAGDLAFSNAQTEGTNALSTRLEAGATVSGPVGLYARAAVGQKYSNTTDFTYYSIEPGISAAVPGVAGLTAKVGYRFRSAAFDALTNKDTTETARVGVSYSLTKVDSVGFRFDRITGDSTQDAYNVFYSRSF